MILEAWAQPHSSVQGFWFCLCLMKPFLPGLRAELFSLHSWVTWPYCLAHSTLAMCSLLPGSERRTPLAPQSLPLAPLGFSLPYVCSCSPLLPHLSPASVWISLWRGADEMLWFPFSTPLAYSPSIFSWAPLGLSGREGERFLFSCPKGAMSHHSGQDCQ